MLNSAITKVTLISIIALIVVVITPAQSDFNILIVRTSYNSGSTTGELFVNGKFIAHTLELPWENNRSYISAIPAGKYTAHLRYDKNDKWRLQLDNVPNRTGVQLHIGNYPSQIQGCVLVGDEVFNESNKIEKSGSAYNRLKTEFYGSATPNTTPDKQIQVTIKYNIGRTELVNKTGVVWRHADTNIWLQGPERLENKEYKRDLKYIYIKYRGPNFYFRFPIHGGRSEFANQANGPWTQSDDEFSVFTRNN
jgi:hypothetical protein